MCGVPCVDRTIVVDGDQRPAVVLVLRVLLEVVVLVVLLKLLVEPELAVALVHHVRSDGRQALVVLAAVETCVAHSDLLAQVGHQALEVDQVFDFRKEEAELASCVLQVGLQVAALVAVEQALRDGHGLRVLEALLDHLLLSQLLAKRNVLDENKSKAEMTQT
jgi:hypothetical protein